MLLTRKIDLRKNVLSEKITGINIRVNCKRMQINTNKQQNADADTDREIHQALSTHASIELYN